MGRNHWTPKQLKILQNEYPDGDTIQVANKIGRSKKSITSMAHLLGLKKSKAFMDSPASGRITATNVIGLNTRFAPLMPGWNKGKKKSDYMSAEAIERTKIGLYKKGNDPHNTRPIGTERLSKDGYIEVKFQHLKGPGSNNRNYDFKHRILYRELYGEIPEGFIVTLKDGNKSNVTADNLLLQSRVDNMIQNAECDNAIVKRFLGIKDPETIENIKKNAPELIKLKRNQVKLNRQINKQHVNR